MGLGQQPDSQDCQDQHLNAVVQCHGPKLCLEADDLIAGAASGRKERLLRMTVRTKRHYSNSTAWLS